MKEEDFDIPMDYDVLDGPLPKYQGNPFVVVNGTKYYLNELKSIFGEDEGHEKTRQ